MNNGEFNLFEIAFNAASEGLVLVNRHAKIEACNKRIQELFQYSKEELIGQPIEILVPDSLKKTHVKYRDGYLDKPKSRPMGGKLGNLMGKRKDGVNFPVEVSLNHFENQGRKMVLGLITDITVRKNIDKELSDTKEKLQALNKGLEHLVQVRTKDLEASQRLHRLIARNFPYGTINVIDELFNYVFVEGKELFRYGLKSELLLGTSYLKRMHESIRASIEAKLTEAFRGINQTHEVEIDDQYYELNMVGLAHERHKITQVLIVENNVTKQRLLAIEQSKALKREKQIGELKSRFVSMASHEFRTPLSAISSSATLIEKYGETSQQPNRVKHVKRIKSSVNNLTSILNDFLSLDKLASGKIVAKLDKVNIHKVIEETIENVGILKQENQSIEFIFDGDQHTCVSDERILRNMLTNLISNGIKYSGEHGVICINGAIKNGKICIEISDNGIGIPEEEQHQVFERFFRAHNVTNIQGTGLGLNIVKRYMDLLEGEISFKSESNVGTTFVLEIPCKIKQNG